MKNFKIIIQNKFFWINYIASLILYSASIPQGVITKSLKSLFVGEKLQLAFFTIIGFITIYILVVALDFALLWPLNWFVNKRTSHQNTIYYHFSTLLLLPHLLVHNLKVNYQIDVVAGIVFSTIVSGLIYIFLLRDRLKSIKNWLWIGLNGISSFLLFSILSTAQILFLALLAKWLLDIKRVIF